MPYTGHCTEGAAQGMQLRCDVWLNSGPQCALSASHRHRVDGHMVEHHRIAARRMVVSQHSRGVLRATCNGAQWQPDGTVSVLDSPRQPRRG
jgi:hypothetical protein